MGLPLSLAANAAGFMVYGIDIDLDKIDQLKNGRSTVEDIENSQIINAVNSGRYIPTAQFDSIKTSEIIVICLPTPLSAARLPDLSYLETGLISIGELLSEDSLVILESTVAPGYTRNTVRNILSKVSHINLNSLKIAYSPERIDPSNKHWSIVNTPKIVSGINGESQKRACEFYSKIINQIVQVSSIEIAETAKLLENSFRFVNVSFINEFSILCSQLEIDISQVIEAAATKPYGFMAFHPGLGVGGHCIPVDPIYLSSKAKSIGFEAQFIDLAEKINQQMPKHFIKKIEKVLGSIAKKKIMVIGIAYKPNVSDIRESPVLPLIKGLELKGASVDWHDDLVRVWNNKKSVSLNSNYDLAVLATKHDYLDLTPLRNIPIVRAQS